MTKLFHKRPIRAVVGASIEKRVPARANANQVSFGRFVRDLPSNFTQDTR